LPIHSFREPYVRDVEVRRQRADLLGPLECLAEYFRGAL
jgi:hypothetical protein